MRRRITALFLALAVPGAALSGAADPPSRAGRLSYLQGEVVIQAESGGPEDAELNRPLTLGDRLMTSRESLAELSLGTATIRLDESTDLRIANLDEDIAQTELNSGTLGIHVRELREAEIFEIDTPHAVVTLRRPGDYRIAIDAQGTTVLAVRTGEAEIDGGQGAIRLTDRQELRFAGDEHFADVMPLGPLNAFDEWAIERERAIADTESTRYVSRDVVGYEDLDRHGRWWSEPGYGHVWAPRVVAGWAPYSFGHWKWISPWGWTWIDRAPWGFAPFHFGRWAFIRHRWCWVPGPRHHRPVYAPAHVAWRGSAHDGPADGAVSWLPLGPRDVYVPRHPASPRYLRNVNVSNAIIDNHARITNVAHNRVRDLGFENRDAPGAVTTVRGSALDAPRAAPGRFRPANPRGPARPVTRESVAALAVERTSDRVRNDDGRIPSARRFDRPAASVRAERLPAVQAEPEQRTISGRSHGAPSAPPRILSQTSRNADRATSRSSAEVRSDRQSQPAASAERSQSSMSRGQSGRSGVSRNRR